MLVPHDGLHLDEGLPKHFVPGHGAPLRGAKAAQPQRGVADTPGTSRPFPPRPGGVRARAAPWRHAASAGAAWLSESSRAPRSAATPLRSLPCQHTRDVGDPHGVRRGGLEATLDTLRRDLGLAIRLGRTARQRHLRPLCPQCCMHPRRPVRPARSGVDPGDPLTQSLAPTASACASAMHSSRWWRHPAHGSSWRSDSGPGAPSRIRRPGRDRIGLPTELGHGSC